MSDPRPCQGENANVCVAEGCFGEACVMLGALQLATAGYLTASQGADLAAAAIGRFELVRPKTGDAAPKWADLLGMDPNFGDDDE